MATWITLSRIVLVIPACLLLFLDQPPAFVGAVMLLNLVELTDLVDGIIARRDNNVTDLGKLLDPLVDSICRGTVFGAFTALKLMPLWMLLIIFYRDLVMAYLRSLAAIKNVAMGARWSGKTKAAVQAIAIQLVALLLLARSMAEHGHSTQATDYWWPVAFGWAAGIGFLVAIKLVHPKLWIVAVFAAGNIVFLSSYWVFFSVSDAAPTWVSTIVSKTDDICFWILAFVTILTAASLVDYIKVVTVLWKSEKSRPNQ